MANKRVYIETPHCYCNLVNNTEPRLDAERVLGSSCVVQNG
jgi:hypothetical protein